MKNGSNHIKGYLSLVILLAIIYAICLQFNMDIIGAIGWFLQKTWEIIVSLGTKIRELDVFQHLFR